MLIEHIIAQDCWNSAWVEVMEAQDTGSSHVTRTAALELDSLSNCSAVPRRLTRTIWQTDTQCPTRVIKDPCTRTGILTTRTSHCSSTQECLRVLIHYRSELLHTEHVMCGLYCHAPGALQRQTGVRLLQLSANTPNTCDRSRSQRHGKVRLPRTWHLTCPRPAHPSSHTNSTPTFPLHPSLHDARHIA